MRELLRTARTVRHLRPAQVVDRVVRGLVPFGRLPDVGGEYGLVERAPCPAAEGRPKMFDGRRHTFCNQTIPFEGSDRWEPGGVGRLWTYNLHYFQYLEGVDPGRGLELILDWMEHNTSPRGPGWEPYPLSLRIREWIEWLHGNPALDPTTRAKLIVSIVSQTEALSWQVEYHLMGNHLLENGVTLCWAGLSLTGPRAERWVDKGLRIMRRELERQVLRDGSHDERSPMYQALAAEALGRLAEVAQSSELGEAPEIARLAGEASQGLIESLAVLVHPDRDFALVNDCALGVAPRHDDLCRRFSVTPSDDTVGSWSLQEAGYLGWRGGNGDYLIFDAGPLGPDHQPGHGHADALSFELSLAGRRVFTDTGVFTYDEGSNRDHDRGTAAHNTIAIDDRDQSELWKAFRCGRRIDIEQARVSPAGDGVCLEGAYRGPGAARLGSVGHRRQLDIGSGRLEARDELTSRGRHEARFRLHLAPGLDVASTKGGWSVLDGDRCIARVACDGFACSPVSAPYHPEFGLELTRTALDGRVEFEDRLQLNWRVLWEKETG